ncbi:Zinc finger protein ZFAT [Madurella mycetomatis]|uniref:Zinc finger protein ZFAT n=1 Tax=Madurella mycetomatis TaxID=100816 RepID=A0A175WBW4_9PEZI|nr:Zinc finger protein ZFAT [Madurella mycetomatis]
MADLDLPPETTRFLLALSEPDPGKTQELGPFPTHLPTPFLSQEHYDYLPDRSYGMPECFLQPPAESYPSPIQPCPVSLDESALPWQTPTSAIFDAQSPTPSAMLTNMADVLGNTHATCAEGPGLAGLGSQSMLGLLSNTSDILPYSGPAWLPHSAPPDQASGHTHQALDYWAAQIAEPQPKATNAPPRFQCELCGEHFANQKNRERHYLSERHNADAPKFKCACKYTQARKDNYRRHLSGCTFPIDSAYSCSCGHQTTDKNEHGIHIVYCRRRRRAKPQKRHDLEATPHSGTEAGWAGTGCQQ